MVEGWWFVVVDKVGVEPEMEMNQNVSKWIKMNQNWLKWIKVNQNGTNLDKLDFLLPED